MPIARRISRSAPALMAPAPAPPPRAGVAAPLPAPEPAVHHPSWTGPRVVTQGQRARGLTPERLASLLQRAEHGDPTAQAELLTQMEQRDAHLASVLATRKRAVAGLPWVIEPASARRRDQEIATKVAEVIRGIKKWKRSLVQALDAIAKGYAFLEIDWRQELGRVWVDRLLFRPPHWFVPDQVRPDVWTLRPPEAGMGQPLEPLRWLRHEVWSTSGSTAGSSALGRVLAWPYLFRNYGIKDWLIFAERCGAPIRTATYRQGTSEADLATLYKALQQLGVDAAAMIPEGTSINFVEAGNRTASADIYQGLITWGAKEMSKAVLGQTLTTEEGSNGTQALGRVHDQVRQDLLESDAHELADTLSEDLIRPLVDWTWGPQKSYPRLAFITDPPEDLKARADLYEKLHLFGVRFPVKHIHELFGIPEPKEGEPIYGGGAAPTDTTAEKRSPQAAALADDGPDPRPLPPLPADAERAIKEALAQGEAGWAEVIAHLRRYLDQANAVGEISALLLTALEQLDLGSLATHLADELVRADLIGRVQVRQDEQPLGEWPKVPPREASEWWRTRAALSEDDWLALGENARSQGFTVARFSTLQARQQIQVALDECIIQGETVAWFEDRYQALLAAEGMAPESPAYIETVFRNNIQTAYAVGRHRQMTSAETSVRRPFWLYDAIMDGRTRPAHRAMDGKVYPWDHPIWQTWYCPNGHRCRCHIRCLTADELRAKGLQVSTDWPTMRVKRQDGTMGPAEIVLPDEGWRRNPALEPHQFDFSVFPEDWRRALRVENPS